VCGCDTNRLRGGMDPEDARLERLRRERYGDDFGKADNIDSSGIFESGADSLVVMQGNDEEEQAMLEKQRRGVYREPKKDLRRKTAGSDAAKMLDAFDLVHYFKDLSATHTHTHTY